MSLNAQQKDALTAQLAELLDCDEPGAFFATLHRIAERLAFHEARRNELEQCLSWQDIADRLARVRQDVFKTQISSDRSKALA